MFESVIRITFLSDWHVGSGLGNGPVADNILYRDTDGLPCLSGRAVKGALREGAWRLGLCRADLAGAVDYFFGTSSVERVSNMPGRIAVGSARLPGDVSAWLLSLDAGKRALYVGDMTVLRAQTALDDRKMVRGGSLRTTECGIPGLFFEAHVELDAPAIDRAWLEAWFAAVCAAVKSMGADRARGLGHCRVEPLGCAGAKLPPEIDSGIFKKAEDAR